MFGTPAAHLACPNCPGMDSRKREDRLAPDGWSTRLAAPGVRATRARCSERIGGAIIAMQWFRVFETVAIFVIIALQWFAGAIVALQWFASANYCNAMVRRRYHCITMARICEFLPQGAMRARKGRASVPGGASHNRFFCTPLSADVVSVVRSSLALGFMEMCRFR